MHFSAKMAELKQVLISSEVYLVCITHSLSTEVEEIMGLLLGYTDREKGVCTITHCIQLKRLDKRKDRVEIAPEQLAVGISVAEQLNHPNSDLAQSSSSQPIQVVGWYHSHPHITVFPSEVDVRTQSYFEQMDPFWIGLIFGVFHTDKKGQGKCPLIAFQSNKSYEYDMSVALANSCDLDGRAKFGGEVANVPNRHSLIPVSTIPDDQIANVVSNETMDRIVGVAKLVSDEIAEAYNRIHDEKGGALSKFHNSSVFSQAVCKLTAGLALPLARSLASRSDLVEIMVENDVNISLENDIEMALN